MAKQGKRKGKIDFVREPIKQITVRIADKVLAYGEEFEKLDERQQVLCLTNIFLDMRDSLAKNTMDRQGMGELSAKDKILTYFKRHVREVISAEEARTVGCIDDAIRRVRQLRESCWAIATNFSGMPSLTVGEYMLMDIEPTGEPHDRNISDAVRKAVFARDNNTCRNPDCQYNMALQMVMGYRYLTPHHLIHSAKKGPNTAENLILVCNKCHTLIHAKVLDPFKWLDPDHRDKVMKLIAEMAGK